jgi:hypothetical protein
MAAINQRTLSSKSEVPRSVAVPVAYELQKAGHRYLDVRYIDIFSFSFSNTAVLQRH